MDLPSSVRSPCASLPAGKGLPDSIVSRPAFRITKLGDLPGGPASWNSKLPLPRAWVQFLGGELRSHKLSGMAGKKKIVNLGLSEVNLPKVTQLMIELVTPEPAPHFFNEYT